MTVETTGVVGAGLMGRDIAGLFANAGYPVTVIDIDDDVLSDAQAYHESELAGELRTGGFAVQEPLVDRISYGTNLSTVSDVDFVVEAVPERLALKRDIMASLEDILAPEAVIGTNTSSLTPGDVAANLSHPERVVLFHFANPPLQRDIVEISGDDAADRALEVAWDMAEAIDRKPIRLHQEYRANGLSRLSASIKCAATWELLEADPAAIDTAATAIGFDRGPLELIDLIGIDVHLATIENLTEAYGDRYKPPAEIHNRMDRIVADGRLGKKSGEGFFEWDGEDCLVPMPDESHDIQPILAALVNEAHHLVGDGVADESTVNEILKRAGGSDVGPFDLADLLGQTDLRNTLATRYQETGATVYKPVF